MNSFFEDLFKSAAQSDDMNKLRSLPKRLASEQLKLHKEKQTSGDQTNAQPDLEDSRFADIQNQSASILDALREINYAFEKKYNALLGPIHIDPKK